MRCDVEIWDVESIGERLKRLRGRKPMERLAREAGVTKDAIWRIETGVTPTPRYDTLDKLARALSVTIDELAGGEPASLRTPRDPAPVDDDEAKAAITAAAEHLEDLLRDRMITPAALAKEGIPVEVTESLLAGRQAPEPVVRRLLALLKEKRNAPWADGLIARDVAQSGGEAAIAGYLEQMMAFIGRASLQDLQKLDAATRERLAALTKQAKTKK